MCVCAEPIPQWNSFDVLVSIEESADPGGRRSVTCGVDNRRSAQGWRCESNSRATEPLGATAGIVFEISAKKTFTCAAVMLLCRAGMDVCSM